MSPELEQLIIFRDYKDEDENFIVSTFLRGLYYGDSWFSFIPQDIFYANYHQVVEAIVFAIDTVISVACLKEDHDTIIGYSVMSRDLETIHWVYVKKGADPKQAVWRRQGIGRALIPKGVRYASHLSTLGRELLPKLEGCKFNPFSLPKR